jgi:hypothetical protein
MTSRSVFATVAFLILAACTALVAQNTRSQPEWTGYFLVTKDEFSSMGRNPYFVLEPGYQLLFEGTEDGTHVALAITVLDETKLVDDVETRIVEERETKEGKLAEISRNYFAISKRTNDVFYFGEDVDIYRNGKVVSHEGSWLAGVGGARFGLAIPGSPLVGARYYQEQAPGKAMDRAEVVRVSVTMGEYKNCLETEETTPLEPESKEHKWYAPGIGLVKDGPFKVVRHGKSN